MGRNTQGVRLIRLDEADRLVGISRVEPCRTTKARPVDGAPSRWRRRDAHLDGAPVDGTPVE